MKKLIVFLLTACTALFLAADDVYLTDGTVLKGILVDADASSVTIETSYGRSTISRGKLKKIVFTASASLPRNGLIGEWLLNGNANDTGGKRYNGKTIGTSPAKNRFGTAGKALAFNGASYVRLPALPAIGNGQLTFSHWVKYGTFSGYHLSGFIKEDMQYAIRLGCTAPGNTCYFNPGGRSDQQFSYAFSKDTWYHFVMVLDGTATWQIYINGVLVKSGSAGLRNSLAAIPYFGLGASVEYSSGGEIAHHISGILDDVRLYGRALSGIEIRSLYHEGGWK